MPAIPYRRIQYILLTSISTQVRQGKIYDGEFVSTRSFVNYLWIRTCMDVEVENIKINHYITLQNIYEKVFTGELQSTNRIK